MEGEGAEMADGWNSLAKQGEGDETSIVDELLCGTKEVVNGCMPKEEGD